MLVSVVIPSYNHSDYVRQAVESVLGQVGVEVDLIVIDDGSRDGSAQLLRNLLAEFGSFRLIARENRGLLHTLNEGLGLARGEFFCELASDDFLPPDSLSKRVSFLQERPECVAVFGDGYSVLGQNVTAERIVDARRRKLFSLPDPIPAMLGGAMPVFATGLFRTGVLRSIAGFDAETFRYYEDLDTPFRLAAAGTVGFLDETLFFRREHETNVSRTTPHIRGEKVLCYSKLLKEPGLAFYRREIRRSLRRSLLALGRYLSRSRGGTAREREVFRRGWGYIHRDPRLLWHLLRWGRN